MGRYLNSARQHFKQIQFLREHSRLNALKQAEFQYAELSNLALKAEQSKKGRSDLAVILELRKASRDLIEEIRHREEAAEAVIQSDKAR